MLLSLGGAALTIVASSLVLVSGSGKVRLELYLFRFYHLGEELRRGLGLCSMFATDDRLEILQVGKASLNVFRLGKVLIVESSRVLVLSGKCLYALLASLGAAHSALHVITHALQQRPLEVARRYVDSVVLKVLLVGTALSHDAVHDEGLPDWREIPLVEVHTRVELPLDPVLVKRE